VAGADGRGTVKPEEVLRRLRRIRREARAILAGRPAPALARSMHTVERACHLAAWQIGDAMTLLPEGDGAQEPPRSTRRPLARRARVRRSAR